MNLIQLGKFAHHGEFAEDLRKRFRVPSTCRRFAVVFRKFQRVWKQKGVQPRRRARPSISRGDPGETLLFLPQMQLCKKMFVVESGARDAFAKIRDRFRDGSYARFVFRGKKKGAQERTVNAIAKRKPCSAHALEQIFR